jgi:hypothetical protein
LPPPFPATKISATILDFGEPLLAPLGGSPPLDVMRAALDLIVCVWNGHVLAMPCWRQPDILEALEAIMRASATPREVRQAYEQLAARRRERFAGDARAVGEWGLVPNHEGGYSFRCDARKPPG